MSTNGLWRYSHTVGFFGLGGKAFTNPVDVGMGRDGRLYVVSRAGPDHPAQMFQKRITMCKVDEEYLGYFGHGGTGDGQIMWPVAILMGRDDNLYISDEALHRISIFDKEGKFLSRWGKQGTGQGELNRPAGIAFDGDENLLVVDSLNNRIQKFTKDGQFLSAWGRPGNGNGEFNTPWGITTDQAGNVYVADWRNDRVQKFDSQGNHLATWGTTGQGEGQFYRPSAVAVDNDGDICVADWGNERVQVLGPDGSHRGTMEGDGTLSIWAKEYYVSNPHEWEARERSNLEIEPESTPAHFLRDRAASIEKLFWAPTSVRIDHEGRLLVVDCCHHRIQVYRKEAQRVGAP